MSLALEVGVVAGWILVMYAWERSRKRRIRAEHERYRRQAHEIFEDLRDCVEHCHE